MVGENNVKLSISSFLNCIDPLCLDAINKLLSHKEEDLYVDYKECFDPNDEKHWHGITTDAVAFANAMGGYIVFGVRDVDFTLVGLLEDAVKALTDTNLVMQKLNRYIAPPFTMIRTKRHCTESGNVITIMHIPESKGKTHIFVKDVSYKYPTGSTKQLAYPGMVFIRRSATNHVVDPEDLEFIINRRIEYYKESILNKIAKVVEAPPDHQVLIFDPCSKANNDKSYFISDSPDAIPVSGMSFTIAPRTDVEEICGWISLSKRDPSFRPTEVRLWHMYSVRNNLVLTPGQIIEMIRFSLLSEMPIFFWLKSLSADDIKSVLLRIFSQTNNMRTKTYVLNVASFLGNTFHTKVLKKLGDEAKRIYGTSRKFPKDPFEPFCSNILSVNEDTNTYEKRLTDIAISLSHGKGGAVEKWRAKALDCRLYARTDKYVGSVKVM